VDTFCGLIQLIKSFLKLLGNFFSVIHDEHTFIKELVTKQNDMVDIVEELYAKTAVKSKNQAIDAEYQRIWKTTTTYAYISYYYYLAQIKLRGLLDQGHMNEDIFMEIIETFESFVNFDPVVEIITHSSFNLGGTQETLQRVAEEVNELLDSYKLVSLYKPDEKKDKIEEAVELKADQITKSSESVHHHLDPVLKDTTRLHLDSKAITPQHQGAHISKAVTPKTMHAFTESNHPQELHESTSKSANPANSSKFSIWPF
jgi:ElaB/YqjD/DUF883 family membrane-anchored ribosome-binding protein